MVRFGNIGSDDLYLTLTVVIRKRFRKKIMVKKNGLRWKGIGESGSWGSVAGVLEDIKHSCLYFVKTTSRLLLRKSLKHHKYK